MGRRLRAPDGTFTVINANGERGSGRVAKGEPVVAVRVELKWSPTLVGPQILSKDTVTSL